VVNSKEYGSTGQLSWFIAYEGDDYKEATKYFDEVSGEEKIQKLALSSRYEL
jgi:hypothetical protein